MLRRWLLIAGEFIWSRTGRNGAPSGCEANYRDLEAVAAAATTTATPAGVGPVAAWPLLDDAAATVAPFGVGAVKPGAGDVAQHAAAAAPDIL